MLSALGPVYAAYQGSLYGFRSMAQLGANGYAGTAAVVIPSTGGLHIQPYSGNSASWPHGGGNALAITDSGWPPGATLILVSGCSA